MGSFVCKNEKQPYRGKKRVLGRQPTPVRMKSSLTEVKRESSDRSLLKNKLPAMMKVPCDYGCSERVHLCKSGYLRSLFEISQVGSFAYSWKKKNIPPG
jgi:hypothetical protein